MTNDPTWNKKQFVSALAAIAKRCETDMGEWEIGVYLQELESFGWDRILPVMRSIYLDLKGRGTMPSVNDIKAKLGGVPLKDDAEAADVAARVLSAVSKYGDVRMNGEYRARPYVGEVGWIAAERMFGSWPNLCLEYSYDNHGQVYAQLRNLAETLLAKARRGELETPTALPEGPGKKVQNLIEGVASALPEVKGWGKTR